jgi:hypothetical protein
MIPALSEAQSNTRVSDGASFGSVIFKRCRSAPVALSYRHSLDTVPKMVLRHSILRRSVAIMLPLCSAWLFIACVTLCSAQSAERQAHCLSDMLNSVCCGQEPGCCPITTALPNVLPERRVGTFLLGDNQAAIVLRAEPTVATLNNSGYTSISVSGADPPLERLHSLRI